MMPIVPIPNLLKEPQLWRLTGFASSVIGLICYALSSPSKHLFGEWNFLKIFLYSVGSLIMCSMLLYAKKWQLSGRLMLKAHMGFFVLMLTSLYSFFNDKAVKGKPDILVLVSCVAFAIMSFSLSRQIDLGFEVDLLYFFLGCLTMLLMKINLMLAFVGAAFCYILIVLRSSLDSQQNTESETETTETETAGATAIDHVAMDINHIETETKTAGATAIDDHVAIDINHIFNPTTRPQRVADHDSNSGIRSEDTNDDLSSQSLRRRRADMNASAAVPTMQHVFPRRSPVQHSSREGEARRIEATHRILAAMKVQHAFGNYDYKTRKMNAAASRIQRIFRAWKIRRESLHKHHQDTKIQPHQSLSLLTTPDSVCCINIKGMNCLSCSSSVESALQALQGVLKFQVTLATEEAQVHYNPNVVTYHQILEAIEDTGYEAALISSGQET